MSPPILTPDDTWDCSLWPPSTAVLRDNSTVKDGVAPPACLGGRHFLSCASGLQEDSRGRTWTGGVPRELLTGLTNGLSLDSYRVLGCHCPELSAGSLHASHLCQHPQREELGSPSLTAFLEPMRPTPKALLGALFYSKRCSVIFHAFP